MIIRDDIVIEELHIDEPERIINYVAYYREPDRTFSTGYGKTPEAAVEDLHKEYNKSMAIIMGINTDE